MADDDGLQINISYDLNGRDPKEVEKLVKKTLKEMAKAGNLDPNAYKVLPQETAEEWELELTTGNDSPACPVVVHVCGVRSDEKPVVLKKNIDGNEAFLPGATDKFLIQISDSIGDVFKLRFGFPDEVAEATWNLKALKLFHAIDKDTYKDQPDLTIKKGPGMDPWQELPVVWPDYPKLQVVKYQVYLTTSIRSGRMDSGANIMIYGDFGNTGKRALKKSLNSKIKFQPGQNDRFEVPAVSLGEIRKIWVQNDCSATNKNWMLDKVVIKETTESEKEWAFKCRRFFDPAKGDKKTERILEIGVEPEPEPGDEERPKSPPKPKPKATPLPEPPRQPSPPPPPPKKEKKEKPPPPPPREPTPPPPPPPKEKKKKEKPPPPPPPEPEPEPPPPPPKEKKKKEKPPPKPETPPPKPETPPPPPPPKEKKKKEKPPPKPETPPPKEKTPEPEPEPEPEEKPETPPPPPPPKEKKKKEKPPPPPPPKKEEPPPKKAATPPPPPPPKQEPVSTASNDDWQMWWENRDEQAPYKNVSAVFTMIGDKGESDEFEISFDMKKGESEKFDFEMELDSIGDLLKVRLRLADEVKAKTKWEIAKLHVKHLRSGEIHTFEFQKAVIKKQVDTAAEASNENIPTRTYICTVHTGNRPGLSPSSKAYLIIRGEGGDTGKRWIINPAEGKQGLKKGEVIKMEIDCVDLGEVSGIRVGHDDAGKSPSYFLEKVVIRPSHRADLQYVFTFESEAQEAAAEIEEQKGQQYDPKDWQLSWVNEQNQPRDFLQVAAILFGEKGQSTSYYIEVELRPGESDGYLIKVEQDIGELIKVRMSNGPNVKGKHPWLIRELRLKNLQTGKLYTFQLGGAGDAGLRRYRVEIFYTSKGVQQLDNARLHVKLFGDKAVTERMWLDNRASGDSQTMGAFDLELPDLGEVNNLRLGHNKKHKQIGFFVSKVIVKPSHLPHKQWLFQIPYEDEEEKDVPVSEWLISWTCSESQHKVLTTVILVLYGEDGKKTPDIAVQTMLRPGQSEETLYMMEKPKQFKPYKIRVGFWDKQYDPINWMLKLVRIRCVKTRNIYTFTLNGMVMFNDERDGWREIAIDVPPDTRRPPTVTYELQVFTSKEVGVVTDSKIYVMLTGKQGDTGKRKLLRSLNNGFKNFIPGRFDTFRIEAVDLDEITHILVGHNDAGRYPSWHCERMVVTDRHGGQVYEFDMNKWFDKSRADKRIERQFPVTRLQRAGLGRKWFVKLKIGDHPRAGTKTSLGLIICGTENTSDVVLLGKNLGVDGFKPKETYEFNVELDLDDIEDVIGEAFKIRLGFMDWNQWPCTLVHEVYLEELVSGTQYYVDVDEWIWASPRHDGWREFQVRGPAQNMNVYMYQLAIWTGPEVQAETNADVYCQIFGSKGDTGKRRLCCSKSHLRPFLRGQTDLFDIEAVELGDIKKITLMLIAEDARDNWHLLKMSLQQHPFNGEEFLFECDRWFDNASHTQMFTPTVKNEGKPYSGPPGEHLVFVTTGNQKDAATNSGISFMVFGEKGQAGPFVLDNPPVIGEDGLPLPVNPKDRPFQQGAIDFFPFTLNEEQTGRIVKVRISNDDKGRSPRWFIEKLAVQNLTKHRVDTLNFNVNDWLADDRGDGELTKEFAAEHPAEMLLQAVRYRVEILIGPKTGSLPYNVECTATLYGNSKHNSGPRRLIKNFDSNKLFQPGKTNVFYMTAVGVGDVTKVAIGHTCMDSRFKLHIRDVTVSWEPNCRITFPCDEIVVKTKPSVPAEVLLTSR